MFAVDCAVRRGFQPRLPTVVAIANLGGDLIEGDLAQRSVMNPGAAANVLVRSYGLACIYIHGW